MLKSKNNWFYTTYHTVLSGRQNRRLWASLILACLVGLSGCTAAQAVTLSESPAQLPTSPILAAPTETFTPAADPTTAPAASPTPGCSEQTGQIETLVLETENLPKPLEVNVYLPPCYHADSSARYPVLYLLHGALANQNQWVELGIPQAADRLILAGKIPPMLVVMPYEEYNLKEPTETNFGTVLVDELVPFIDQTYQTCTARECRAIGGLSRGAAWAVRLGFTRWEAFGAVGGHSLALFWGDDRRLMVRWIKNIPTQQIPPVYLDIGINDSLKPSVAQFEAKLTDLKIPHTWLLNPGEHTAEYWSLHVPEYLEWYGKIGFARACFVQALFYCR